MAKLLLKPLSRVDDNSYKIMSIGKKQIKICTDTNLFFIINTEIVN